MAVSILALQRQVTDLRSQLEAMRTTKPDPFAKLKFLLEMGKLIGQALSTTWGQALIGFLMAACAGAIRWLMGG